jgi:hypothetical protein
VKTGPTWVMFLVLGLASFAPVAVGLRPDWWMPYYYGALLVWWVWMSIARVRWEAGSGPTEMRAVASARRASGRRLIVVARDEGRLYDRLRRSGVDDAVTIITDRRSTERRLQLQVYIPDRRRGERRRYDIESLLFAEGWAEVMLPRR